MTFRLIEHRLQLPSEPAWFDEATLIIGTQSERTVAHAEQKHWQHPAAAIGHELVHFYQTISTPFLLEWAVNWRTHAAELFPTNASQLSDGLSHYFRTLKDDPQISAVMTSARGMVKQRTSPGVHGLSVNDLLEAHAFFLEARLYGSGGDSPRAFLTFLDEECPSPQYRRAYDLVRLWCGDMVAYRAFHAIIISSLCTPRPLERFDELLVECARMSPVDLEGFVRRTALLWDQALALIKRSSPGHSEVRGFVDSFLDWSFDLEILDLIASPECLLSFPCHPTVVYAGDESGRFSLLPASWLPEYVATLDETLQESFLVSEYTLAAISQWLLKECVSDVEESPLMRDECAWLELVSSDDLELSVVVDNWGADLSGDVELVDDAIQRDVERLLRVVSDLGAGRDDPLCLMALRRLRLQFVTDSDLEVWEIPEVRTFIARAALKIPWLPMLLRYPKPETMFLVWFGSLAPASTSGLSIDMSHPEVRAELLTLLESVEHISGKFDLTPCLKAALYPLSR